MNTNSFISKSKIVHGEKYDYSLVDYKKSKLKVNILCSSHGIFEQKPNRHLGGQGCPKCARIQNSNSIRHSHSEIITLFQNIHNNKYDYSMVEYKNYNTPVEIICSQHGIFIQSPKTHILKKAGCPKCAVEYKANNLKLTQLDFITISNKTHNNKYDYSQVNYVNNRTKVIIVCPSHGKFEQVPSHHMIGVGCPHCNDSKGELKVKDFLENNNIEYTRNKTFDDCFDLDKLRFDFYLSKLNTIIEFDGIQHYRPIEAWGGKETFIRLQRRDKIKNEYCTNNSIPLIRIRYNENIENKLNILL